ncbi:MAG: hypothetical protein SVC26_06605 [Pseudomonadota bacterium]|nr:hypothetical protein [Pseudomonadota bacterium]
MFNENQLETVKQMRADKIKSDLIAKHLGMTSSVYTDSVNEAIDMGRLEPHCKKPEPWSEKDVRKVVAMLKEGQTSRQIARQMGVKVSVFANRVTKLVHEGDIPLIQPKTGDKAGQRKKPYGKLTKSEIHAIVRPLAKDKNKPWSINMGQINPNYTRSTRYKWA